MRTKGVSGSLAGISEALPLPHDQRLNQRSGASAAVDVTGLLRGEAALLYDAVYAELRAIATRKMASERQGHTLQPTALVHEAWLKFGARQFANRVHFFAAAAEAMRQILVDSARRKNQLKRGGNFERVELFDYAVAPPDESENLVKVHEALEELAIEDALKAEIVKLRYYVGMNFQEIADALGVNEKTVRRNWEVARIRLFGLISDSLAEPAATSPPAGDK